MSEIATASLTEIRAAAAPTLVVSAPPHQTCKDSVARLMLITLAALMPAAVLSVLLYGTHVLMVMALGIATAAATEWIIGIVRQRRFALIDWSACITGLLLAFSLPPRAPLWLAPLGCVFAIAVAKMAMGGFGRNFLNPALAGRAFLLLSFPAVFSPSAGAAPHPATADASAFFNLFIGYQGSWIGAASAASLFVGAAVLWYFRIIDFLLPLAFIFTSFILFWLAGGESRMFTAGAFLTPLFYTVTGGVLLTALFMATDPVTSPVSACARLLSGLGCGALTWFFYAHGQGYNGPVYAVLVTNCLVPWLDRLCVRRALGLRRRRSQGRTEEGAMES